MIEEFLIFLVVFIAPLGFYYLLRKFIAATLNFLPFFRPNPGFEKKLQRKFNLAYEKNNKDEILKVEEDAMYSRLNELSKPGLKIEERKIHILSVIEWVVKNNYPGNKKQIDLLIKALKYNQKNPDITNKISQHLSYISANISTNALRKSDAKIKVQDKIVISRSPRTISSWFVIIIWCIFIFCTGLLDRLHESLQPLFFILLFTVWLITWKRTFNLHLIGCILLAFALTVGFSSIYSFWHHVNAEFQKVGNESLGIQAEFPLWLTAKDIPPDNNSCTQKISIKSTNKAVFGFVNFDNNYLEIFLDDTCKDTIFPGHQIDLPLNTSITLYIKPKGLRSLIKNSVHEIYIDWQDASSGQQEDVLSVKVYFESIFWHYSSQWQVSAFGIIFGLLSGYLSKFFQQK